MSKSDAAVLASRTLAVLITVWVLVDISYLPERVYSLLRYTNQGLAFSSSAEHWKHYYIIAVGFLLTRVVGLSLLARWLYRGGPEVENLLLPTVPREDAVPI
ncbi:MAG TPA: hypothetical protein VFO39_10640 [Candidatus Sulfotelmatobacter sp.]|nr:hypothetical protein [Candidatus Sulfotelmatobacter sp.]